MKGTLAVTGDADADQLLNTDPLALLIGMLLDQQVPMEWAFRGPAPLRERLAASSTRQDRRDGRGRARHRFLPEAGAAPLPASMARRAHEMCVVLSKDYDGDAAKVWETATTGEELFARLRALPGYGDEKSKIFVAILAKRMGVTPNGWEQVAGPFADPEPRSVADIDSPEALEKVRQWKKAKKAAGKSKQD